MIEPKLSPQTKMRWWPGVLLVVGMLVLVTWMRGQEDWPFQKRNQNTAVVAIVTGILLVVWWTFFSRAPQRLRLFVTFGGVGLVVLGVALFRIRGMSGDLIPILEFRWSKGTELPAVRSSPTNLISPDIAMRTGFPQYLGGNRDGVLAGIKLDPAWAAHPPELIWRKKVGAGWSGFAIVGDVAITQEQQGEDECVVAYELLSGKQRWRHADPARYNTVIASEGPRAVPTVVGERVFTCGGTGLLNCLDRATGKLLWTRNVVAESGGKVPQWGYTCSPLVVADLVIVHGGEEGAHSLLAFQVADGKKAWSGGTFGPSYSAPRFATVAGMPQILSFNHGSVSGHNSATGVTLWEKPWGNGNVVCASPVVVNSNQVLFSSGYGYGAELLELSPAGTNRLAARLVWKSIRMKSKFAHLYTRAGNLYGLDDGIFACVNLADGSQRWKEGRYGHGQGLLVDDLYLLMAESGELVLLRPTPEAPNELARFRVFNAKTWNPIALSGDLLLVRNDQEAACLRLKLADYTPARN
ncbi:MAG: PQQ-like beta-propeller repeat protein [Verrucomicrobiota bacterium]